MHAHAQKRTSTALLVQSMLLTWCHGACGAGIGGQSEKSYGCSLYTGKAWCLCACENGGWVHLNEQISRSSHPRCIYKASLLKRGIWQNEGNQRCLDTGKRTEYVIFYQGFGQNLWQSLWGNILYPYRNTEEKPRWQSGNHKGAGWMKEAFAGLLTLLHTSCVTLNKSLLPGPVCFPISKGG